MDKFSELKKLESKIIADTSTPLRESNLVFGEGSPDCDVMFIGEGPGFHEDRSGRPFVGRGGQLLDRMIESIGWRRRDVYIANIIKRRPPNNRDPLPEEIAAYAPYLAKQIEIINPKVIVCLGRFAMNYFLPDAKISRDHGKVFRLNDSPDSEKRGRTIFPVYHPAAALRSTGMLNVLQEDFKKIPKVVSGEIGAVENNVLGRVEGLSDVREEKKQKKPLQKGLF